MRSPNSLSDGKFNLKKKKERAIDLCLEQPTHTLQLKMKSFCRRSILEEVIEMSQALSSSICLLRDGTLCLFALLKDFQ